MAEAGWYPDPAGGEGIRYFDGTRWTEHAHQPTPPPVAPPAPAMPSPPASPPPQPARGQQAWPADVADPQPSPLAVPAPNPMASQRTPRPPVTVAGVARRGGARRRTGRGFCDQGLRQHGVQPAGRDLAHHRRVGVCGRGGDLAHDVQRWRTSRRRRNPPARRPRPRPPRS